MNIYRVRGILCKLVHDAARDVVGDLEGVDFFEPLVELLVERLSAPAGGRKKIKPGVYRQGDRHLVTFVFISSCTCST